MSSVGVGQVLQVGSDYWGGVVWFLWWWDVRFSNPSLVDFALVGRAKDGDAIIYHLPVGCLDCFPVVYCMAENVFGWEESY